MEIRYAQPKDLDELARIEAISYPKAEGASKESIRTRLVAFPKHFWVLEDAGEIFGFINGMVTNAADLQDEMYDHPEMHTESGSWQMIFSVVTSPEYRRHGYAGKIMERVLADAKEQKRLGVVLTCKERLLPFYAKFGFKNEGISGSTHGGAVWYQMRLAF